MLFTLLCKMQNMDGLHIETELWWMFILIFVFIFVFIFIIIFIPWIFNVAILSWNLSIVRWFLFHLFSNFLLYAPVSEQICPSHSHMCKLSLVDFDLPDPVIYFVPNLLLTIWLRRYKISLTVANKFNDEQYELDQSVNQFWNIPFVVVYELIVNI